MNFVKKVKSDLILKEFLRQLCIWLTLLITLFLDTCLKILHDKKYKLVLEIELIFINLLKTPT